MEDCKNYSFLFSYNRFLFYNYNNVEKMMIKFVV